MLLSKVRCIERTWNREVRKSGVDNCVEAWRFDGFLTRESKNRVRMESVVTTAESTGAYDASYMGYLTGKEARRMWQPVSSLQQESGSRVTWVSKLGLVYGLRCTAGGRSETKRDLRTYTHRSRACCPTTQPTLQQQDDRRGGYRRPGGAFF